MKTFKKPTLLKSHNYQTLEYEIMHTFINKPTDCELSNPSSG